MIKICYVVTIPLTIRAFFIPQLKYLSENGFDVSVVCSPDDNLQSELGAKINYIPVEIPRGIAIGRSLSVIRKLKKLFKDEKFDIVQYSTPNAAMYASVSAKNAGIGIRNYHLMGLRYLGSSGVAKAFLKTLEKFSCANSTSVECVSRSNLELSVKEGLFKENKGTVVWNGSSGGVDLSRFSFENRSSWRSQIRKELGIHEDDFTFGFVGRITKDKGVNELLSAYLSLGDTDGVKLLLVGYSEGENTLDPDLLGSAKKRQDVIFHGGVKDIERYYAAMDCLILPSYREGFGNVVIEAAAVGTPAIVSDIPGPIDTVIRDKTALVIPVKNSEALADAMKKMMSSDYKQMGMDAHDFVASSFDSRILNEKILERKKFLLGNK